jgi:hypothetical protein
MSSSKPEELVAKLYDEGMSDDEVKEQLEEFGLSGREIHHLIKKAQEVKKEQSKADKQEKSKEVREDKARESRVEPKEHRDEKNEKKENNRDNKSNEEPKEKKGGFFSRFGKKKDNSDNKPKESFDNGLDNRQSDEEKRLNALGARISGEKKDDKKESEDKEKDKKSKENNKKNKKEDKKTQEDLAHQAKMKRLSLIKDAISQPMAEKVVKEPVAVKEQDLIAEDLDATRETGDSLINISDLQRELTPEEEEKVDAETAKQLTDKMDTIETELGNMKELLESLKELNIKIVEIMEKK